MSTTPPSDADIFSAMIIYGGGFVSRLGWALRHADSKNIARFKAAFPGLLKTYGEMALRSQLKKGKSK